MIAPRMSVVPRVKNNGLYLYFLSLLSQTVHSSPNYPTILDLQAFCTPAAPPHPTLPVLSLNLVSPVSSSTRPRAKKVWVPGQEVGHIRRESSLERLRDVVPNEAVKGEAPGPGLTGSACSSKRKLTDKEKLNPYHVHPSIMGCTGGKNRQNT